MQKTKRNARAALIAAFALCLTVGLAACAPQAATESGSADAGAQTSQAKSDGTGAYESDEQCLSCHGGSYEALAETTSSYGPSNPHDSIHGGYNSCVNCHARDKEITDNQCLHCHDWPHNPAS